MDKKRIEQQTFVNTLDDCWNFIESNCDRMAIRKKGGRIDVTVWLKPGRSTWRKKIAHTAHGQLLHTLRHIVFEIILDGRVEEQHHPMSEIKEG